MTQKTNFEKVKEFHEAFNHPVRTQPMIPDMNEQILREDLIDEEFKELKRAMVNDDIVEVADAIGDLLYVVYGAALVCGINADKVFDEVHKSNMSKLGDDGKPIYREDGKILKGENFKKPDIAKVIFND